MMYVWDSVFLSDYSNGKIIVVANNVEEARKKAYEHFLKEYVLVDWGVAHAVVEGYDDEFYGDLIIRDRENFLYDISQEPEIMDVVFVEGCS